MANTCIFVGEELAAYGFPDGHPFSTHRHAAFYNTLLASNLYKRVCICEPQHADVNLLQLFHTNNYISKVKNLSTKGCGYLDAGDTPAFPGIFEAASCVVGTTIAAINSIMSGKCQHAFNPIGGLHHARRDTASGFCVFNDIGVAIEYLQSEYKINQILYVDIDAHHGDGVFYSYEDNENVIFLDFHQDSQTLYPGTGQSTEIGTGRAAGLKLNIEMPPASSDADFLKEWETAKQFIDKFTPEFILLQCGADSIMGDPITNLCYSSLTHKFVTEELIRYANKHCRGKMIALGGGGYNLENISTGWLAVTERLINA